MTTGTLTSPTPADDRIGHPGRVAAALRPIAAATLGGALAGLIVGGILSRLAMRLLTLTSSDGLRGRITDHGATVGDITLAGSATLAGFTMAIGAVGGLVYLLARRILPETTRRRAAWFGLFTASLGGALIVEDITSFDFAELRPQWLSIVLFVLLPLIYGPATAWLVDTMTAPGSWLQRTPLPIVAILGLGAMLLPPIMLIGAAAFVITLLVSSIPLLATMWRSRPITIFGWLLFATTIAVGVFGLAWDIASIATGRPLDTPLPF